jgi:hypothetical protein
MASPRGWNCWSAFLPTEPGKLTRHNLSLEQLKKSQYRIPHADLLGRSLGRQSARHVLDSIIEQS